MAKVNCWEFKRCGREPGGAKASELGVCVAASARGLEGTNGGRLGGRACWAIAGTLCGGVVQGTFATKLSNCIACAFYQAVVQEEGRAILSTRDIIAKIGA